MLVPSWMLLWLEEGVKVPEGALNEVIGGHFRKTEKGNTQPLSKVFFKG